MSSSRGGGGRGNSKSVKVISWSSKVGFQLPLDVGRITRHLKTTKYFECVSAGAPVYLSTVLEYLAANVLELASNTAMDNKKNQIMPRHILLAMKNDEELSKLLGTVTIIDGGMMPNIHQTLFAKKACGKGDIGSASQKL